MMRKEISSLFRIKKTKAKTLLILLAIAFFMVINGIFVYIFNFNGYYFYLIKKVVPYPAMIVGDKIVTYAFYDDMLNSNQKIYETTYRVNFTSGAEGANNLNQLRSTTKEDIIENGIVDGLLSSIGQEVSNMDVKKEYENVLHDIGSDKDILNILKYSAGINDKDIKNKIYQNISRERVKNNFIFNLKMKVVFIKPDNPADQGSWDAAQNKATGIYNDIAIGKTGFDQAYALYGDKNDIIVQNFGREYYFSEDLPKDLQETFFALRPGVPSKPVKSDSGYYIMLASDIRGYYRGTLGDFINERKQNLRIISFLH